MNRHTLTLVLSLALVLAMGIAGVSIQEGVTPFAHLLGGTL